MFLFAKAGFLLVERWTPQEIMFCFEGYLKDMEDVADLGSPKGLENALIAGSKTVHFSTSFDHMRCKYAWMKPARCDASFSTPWSELF